MLLNFATNRQPYSPLNERGLVACSDSVNYTKIKLSFEVLQCVPVQELLNIHLLYHSAWYNHQEFCDITTFIVFCYKSLLQISSTMPLDVLNFQPVLINHLKNSRNDHRQPRNAVFCFVFINVTYT